MSRTEKNKYIYRTLCSSTLHETNNFTGNKFQDLAKFSTVKPLYYRHQGDRNKFPYYRGVRFREVGFIWISVSQGPSELSVKERCPYLSEVSVRRGSAVALIRLRCTYKLSDHCHEILIAQINLTTSVKG